MVAVFDIIKTHEEYLLKLRKLNYFENKDKMKLNFIAISLL